MMLVKTKIGPSKINGTGLFANQFIPNCHTSVQVQISTNSSRAALGMRLNSFSGYPATWNRTLNTMMFNRASYIQRSLISFGVPATAFGANWFMLNTGATITGGNIPATVIIR